MKGLGSVSIKDNTDDQEPAMVANKHQMGINMNDPDLQSRQKMKLSFDPFEPQLGSFHENKLGGRNDLGGALENTINSKVLRALESPKSC